MMKFLKAISNLLRTLLIELTLLVIKKSLQNIRRWQKWKLLIQPLNKNWRKKNKSLLTMMKKQNQAGHENSLMKKVNLKNEFINEEEKTRKRLKKSYRERVKDRTGEYFSEKKPFQKSSKSHKNNMSEAEFISEVNVKNLKLKKSNKPSPPKHPRERRKLIEKKMAKKNSKSILSGTFDFDPEEYLKKLLLFDLKNTSQEKIFDAIIKKLPILTHITSNIAMEQILFA